MTSSTRICVELSHADADKLVRLLNRERIEGEIPVTLLPILVKLQVALQLAAFEDDEAIKGDK